MSILIRCATKRRFAEILASQYRPADEREINAQVRDLRVYGLLQEITPDRSRYERENAAVVKPDTIYFNPCHHCPAIDNGRYVDEWFELGPYIPKP